MSKLYLEILRGVNKEDPPYLSGTYMIPSDLTDAIVKEMDKNNFEKVTLTFEE